MKLSFDVTLQDGKKVQVKTAYADLIALEDEFNIDASDMATRQRAKWLAFLAWHALKRTGETTAKFSDFQNEIAELEPAEAGQGNE